MTEQRAQPLPPPRQVLRDDRLTSENPTRTDTHPTDPVDDDEVGEITLLGNRAIQSDGGSDITGYQLQVLDVSTRTWVAEKTLADDVETYTDEDLEPGKLYYYILRAVNDISVGPWTPFVTATAAVGLPDAPELTATATSRSTIDLSWTASGRQRYAHHRLPDYPSNGT